MADRPVDLWTEEQFTRECSLDGGAFAGCTSPWRYTSLTPGSHSFAVRAIDAASNVDPTPASHAWTVRASAPCPASVTLTASADAWIDENSPSANKGDDSVLKVQSKGPGDDFRALVRFTLPAVGEGCGVAAATLRLHSEKDQPGRTLEVRRLTTPWSEMGVTWSIRPPTAGEPVRGPAREGELRFDVTSRRSSPPVPPTASRSGTPRSTAPVPSTASTAARRGRARPCSWCRSLRSERDLQVHDRRSVDRLERADA